MDQYGSFALISNILLMIILNIILFFIFLENSVDLGYLYEFLSELKRLSITDFISQISNGEQHEISFAFDLCIFTKIEELQVKSTILYFIQKKNCWDWESQYFFVENIGYIII